ncbi:MAG: tRNA lysidine(34) synthetase TilS [Thermotogae bacterium]|nr:tRNA lysidine(34) synthetase TilS [Thermotogota bacterium]
MEDLIERFTRFLEEEALVKKGDTLVLAISGGADSMAMLDLFTRIAPQYRLELVGAHLNHKLREEADDDARFVEDFLLKRGIEVFVKECDVAHFARVEGLSLEEAGRKARYDFFEEVRLKTNANAVALAHNLDDLVETILYRLVRGTGPKGLVAMKPKDGAFIRPLLDFSSSELRSYVTIKGIPYRVDRTNFDIKIPRNLIRHLVVTQLKLINPKLHLSFARFHRLMRELVEHLDNEVTGFVRKHVRPGCLGLWQELPVGELILLDGFVLKEVLRYLALHFSPKGYGPSLERMEAVSKALKTGISWIIEVEDGVVFERSGRRLYVSNKRYCREWSVFQVNKPGTFVFGPFELVVRRSVASEPVSEQKIQDLLKVVLPLEGGKARVTKALEIEKFKLRGHRRSVRDLLRERGIPKLFRGIWPCVLDDRERVLWIPGVAVSDEIPKSGRIVNYVMKLRGGSIET